MAGIRVYQHANYDGLSAYWHHTEGYRYYRIWERTLSSVHLQDRISSARVYATAGEAETAILFQDAGFKGRFVALSGADPSRDVASLGGSLDFNDRTSSLLLVAHSRNEFLSLRLGENGRSDAEEFIDAALDGDSGVSRRGHVVFTWEMWPDFDPTKKFVRIDIPIRVHVPNWWDYDARITYYVYLYIDAQYRLRGYVNWVETWVEGGVLSGSISAQLQPDALDSAGDLNGVLTDSLAELDYHEWDRYYLMPGLAPSVLPQDYAGHVEDDVSIILVQRS
jgi:hypothetical protein